MQSRKLHVPDKIAYGVVRGHRTERITPTGVWRRENKNSFLEEEVCEVGLQGCPVRDHAKTERKKKKGFFGRESRVSESEGTGRHPVCPRSTTEHHVRLTVERMRPRDVWGRGLGPDCGDLEPRPRNLDRILWATGAAECLETFFKRRSDRSKRRFGELNLAAAWEME